MRRPVLPRRRAKLPARAAEDPRPGCTTSGLCSKRGWIARNLGCRVAEYRLRHHEDVLEGIGQVPRALLRLYAGLNIGKQIVRVDPDAC